MAREKESQRRKTTRKIIGFLFVIVTLSYLTYKIFKNPADVASLFGESNKELFLVLLALQILSFLANAFVSKALLSFVNETVSFGENFKIAIMNEFGNRLMPLFGGSITSYIGYRRLKLSPAAIIFLETTWVGLIFGQYLLFFFLSVLIIPHIYIALIPKLALLIVSVALSIGIATWYTFIRKNKQLLLKKIVLRFFHIVEYVFPVGFDEKGVESNVDESSREIANNFAIFFSKKKPAIITFFLASLYYVIDILMLYMAFLTFSFHVPLALVAFGMLLSLLISVITLFPGQPGVTEASFVLTFSAFGVPTHIAILASIAYRLASYWLWLPLSTYYTFKNKPDITNKTSLK